MKDLQKLCPWLTDEQVVRVETNTRMTLQHSGVSISLDAVDEKFIYIRSKHQTNKTNYAFTREELKSKARNVWGGRPTDGREVVINTVLLGDKKTSRFTLDTYRGRSCVRSSRPDQWTAYLDKFPTGPINIKGVKYMMVINDEEHRGKSTRSATRWLISQLAEGKASAKWLREIY